MMLKEIFRLAGQGEVTPRHSKGHEPQSTFDHINGNDMRWRHYVDRLLNAMSYENLCRLADELMGKYIPVQAYQALGLKRPEFARVFSEHGTGPQNDR